MQTMLTEDKIYELKNTFNAPEMDWKGIGTSFYSLACAIGDYASLKYKLDVSELEKGNKKPFYRLVHRWAEASKNTALMKSYHFSGNEPFTSDDERMRSCLIEHCLKMAEAYVICVIGGAGAGKTQILTGYARMLGKILYDNGLRVEEKYCDPELIPEGRTYDEPEMQYKFLSGFSCHAFAAAAEGTSDGVLMPGAYDSEATREFPTTYPIHKPNTPIKQHAKTSSERNFPEFGVFLLDEVTNATQSQLTAVFKLAEEAREINGYKVPAGWIVIMAGNGREYNNYTAFPQALIQRSMFCRLRLNPNDWISWASDHGVDPHIVSFLRLYPQALLQTPKDIVGVEAEPEPGDAFQTVSPRNWAALNAAICKDAVEIQNNADDLGYDVGEFALVEKSTESIFSPKRENELLEQAQALIGNTLGSKFTNFCLTITKVNLTPDMIWQHGYKAMIQPNGQPINMTISMFVFFMESTINKLKSVFSVPYSKGQTSKDEYAAYAKVTLPELGGITTEQFYCNVLEWVLRLYVIDELRPASNEENESVNMEDVSSVAVSMEGHKAVDDLTAVLAGVFAIILRKGMSSKDISADKRTAVVNFRAAYANDANAQSLYNQPKYLLSDANYNTLIANMPALKTVLNVTSKVEADGRRYVSLRGLFNCFSQKMGTLKSKAGSESSFDAMAASLNFANTLWLFPNN